ncbi:MAG: hypothetical protein HKN68_21890 [Saprospiraceae bacterium]|nr:hypothetical protein [Saprospiraceae bacterium]
MLIGIALGFYLSMVIFLSNRKEKGPLIFFGWMILCTSLISLDIYLCHTGWMKEVIFLNDSTESLVLLLGPLIYLFLHTGLINPIVNWKNSISLYEVKKHIIYVS